MKIIALSPNILLASKLDTLVFAIYSINIQGDYICLASYRNFWDARKKFLDFKTNCPDNLFYFVECSEEEYFTSLKKIKKHKAKGFIQNLFKF